MQNLEFTHEEVEILREMLEHHLNDLEVEVGHTDKHDFKEMLKHRRAVLERVLGKVSSVPVG